VNLTEEIGSDRRYDAVLVGAGIMSSTLAVLLHELEPEMRLLIIERLEAPGLESSSALNNAGTGHAANCELNYTPLQDDRTINIEKALNINFSYEQSLELWASLIALGKLRSPNTFLNFLPHISFVWGNSDVDFLKTRFDILKQYPSFNSMEWSMDKNQLKEWMPLVLEGRNNQDPIAATRIKRGTDIDFGALTTGYLEYLEKNGSVELQFSTEVLNLRKNRNSSWTLELQNQFGIKEIQAPFVFLGAGGGTLTLLQKSGIPESKLYGGFPVSGKWLICDQDSLASRHNAKVYGKAGLGAPPMSVPHLDSRWVSGKKSLLFGPFAGVSTKFLKNGSFLDLFKSVNSKNIAPMIQVGWNNIDLIKYLIGQLSLDEEARLRQLKDFIPNASEIDWQLSTAGQRVQIIKRTKKGGVLKMGTEVVTSSDGSLAALLGASPGASTAVTIMLDVLNRCWSENMKTNSWKEKMNKLLPSYGKNLNKESSLLKEVRARNNSLLGFVDIF
tara:strand:- start:21435 stop:22937 length:1503 start_codon:yes stop_codon:yes gene_type:complete